MGNVCGKEPLHACPCRRAVTYLKLKKNVDTFFVKQGGGGGGGGGGGQTCAGCNTVKVRDTKPPNQPPPEKDLLV
jgi:hypothetical protein